MTIDFGKVATQVATALPGELFSRKFRDAWIAFALSYYLWEQGVPWWVIVAGDGLVAIAILAQGIAEAGTGKNPKLGPASAPTPPA